MSNKVAWGVIGSGGIARRRTIPEGLVPAENAGLAVVYDIDTAANSEIAAELNVTAARTIQDLLATDIDAVYIATPAVLHKNQVLECAQAGKHILCEKPLGMTVAETKEMIAACKDANVQLGTAFMMRFHAQHQAALQMVQKGDLGELVFGRAQLSCWYPPIEGTWRQTLATGGGGSLMDMGGHCIDLLEMYFSEVQSVSCFIKNSIHDYESEDSAIVNLSFKNGGLATVDTFFCIPDDSSKNVLELYGSKGSILAKGTIGQGESGEMIAYLEDSDSSYDAQQARAKGDGFDIFPEPVNMYKAEIEEFSQALLENRESSLKAVIGEHSQKVLAACYESAATGKIINLD